jgi:hypothetical protein
MDDLCHAKSNTTSLQQQIDVETECLSRVMFTAPETVFTGHEKNRLAQFKRSDEPAPLLPMFKRAVEFQTSEAQLFTHERPRSLALKRGDEPHVKSNEAIALTSPSLSPVALLVHSNDLFGLKSSNSLFPKTSSEIYGDFSHKSSMRKRIWGLESESSISCDLDGEDEDFDSPFCTGALLQSPNSTKHVTGITPSVSLPLSFNHPPKFRSPALMRSQSPQHLFLAPPSSPVSDSPRMKSTVRAHVQSPPHTLELSMVDNSEFLFKLTRPTI